MKGGNHPSDSRRSDLAAEAAEWAARRDAGFNGDDAREYERWLAADPARKAAMAEVEASWKWLQQSRASGTAPQVMSALHRRAERRAVRRRIAGGTAIVAAAFAAFFSVRSPQPTSIASDVPSSTVVLRPERRILADGSVVELNADAEIDVRLSAARRDVRLLRGEAHFAVASDPARPFVVSAKGVDVKAVGTEFTVKIAPRGVDVLVVEGRVAVARVEAGAIESPQTAVSPVLVAAGARLVLPQVPVAGETALPEAVSADTIALALAWRGKRVEFSGTTLGEAVMLFNRENRVQLSLGKASLANQRISGIFWLDNPEAFARLLETVLELRVDGDSDCLVLNPAR